MFCTCVRNTRRLRLAAAEIQSARRQSVAGIWKSRDGWGALSIWGARRLKAQSEYATRVDWGGASVGCGWDAMEAKIRNAEQLSSGEVEICNARRLGGRKSGTIDDGALTTRGAVLREDRAPPTRRAVRRGYGELPTWETACDLGFMGATLSPSPMFCIRI